MANQHTIDDIKDLYMQAAGLQLRLAGDSYNEIAIKLGLSKSGAYKLIKRAIERTVQEPADELRKIELARLDALMFGHWDRAVKGGKDATELVLKIMARRARLVGLDAPARVDISNMIMDMATAAGLDPEVVWAEATGILSTTRAQA